MPKICKPGDMIRNYTIVERIDHGGRSVSFRARKHGSTEVFLKQYISPTPLKQWYRPFIDHQAELHRRINAHCHLFCYRCHDLFEENRCYFQVFELLERSDSLEEILKVCQTRPGEVSAERRLIWARVFLSGMCSIHEAGIIHCDVKPANVMLIEDKTIHARYQLKIIDFDSSLIVGRPAPWQIDPEVGYFGTWNYMSPEHLRGEPPLTASDVYSCGLILYELLGPGHPYRNEDETVYREATLGHRAAPPAMATGLDKHVNVGIVQSTLHRCLSPRATDRPSIQELRNAIGSGERPRPTASPIPQTEASRGSESPPRATSRLVLTNDEGRSIGFGVRAAVGRVVCSQLGTDAQYLSDVQFYVEPEGGQWYVIPVDNVTNETLLNGKKVTERSPLQEGAVLSVGRESKGIYKLPMRIAFHRGT